MEPSSSPTGKWLRAHFQPALCLGLRNADTQSGSMPAQIIQIEFSGKLSSFFGE